MDIVLAVCGVISAIGLLVQLPDGGWRRTLPVFAWLTAAFALAALLPTAPERAAAVLLGLAGAFVLARRLPDRRRGGDRSRPRA